jgi:hypothetical protein
VGDQPGVPAPARGRKPSGTGCSIPFLVTRSVSRSLMVRVGFGAGRMHLRVAAAWPLSREVRAPDGSLWVILVGGSSRSLASLAEYGDFLTQDRTAAGVVGESAQPQGWRAGAVRPPTEPRLVKEIEGLELRNPAFLAHRETLVALGSQAVYAAPCRVRGSEDCDVALIRFSGAIESAFGFTREVMFFYSPYRDLQYRTFGSVTLR